MRGMFLKGAAILVAALALAACASGAKSGGTKTITQQVWGWYLQYKGDIGPNQAGAFAVSENGTMAYYFYCTDINCMKGAMYKRKAIEGCEKLAEEDCYVFAFRQEILVSYKIQD